MLSEVLPDNLEGSLTSIVHWFPGRPSDQIPTTLIDGDEEGLRYKLLSWDNVNQMWIQIISTSVLPATSLGLYKAYCNSALAECQDQIIGTRSQNCFTVSYNSTMSHASPIGGIWFLTTTHADTKNKMQTKCVHHLCMLFLIVRSTRIPKIADVAVTKRHQRLDEIRITFTRTLFKSCFLKSSVMLYTPSTLNAIQFTHHTLTHLL